MSDDIDPKERWPHCLCNFCQADEHWWSELLANRDRTIEALTKALHRARNHIVSHSMHPHPTLAIADIDATLTPAAGADGGR